MGDYNSSGFNENLAFDLRQKYAQIVGFHLEEVALARKEKNFSKYFEALEDLYTVTCHKFKAPKKIKDENKKNRFVHLKYSQLKKEFVDLTNKYESVYIGNSTDVEGYNLLFYSLRRIEMFLYYKMNQANMFGSKVGDDEGL